MRHFYNYPDVVFDVIYSFSALLEIKSKPAPKS